MPADAHSVVHSLCRHHPYSRTPVGTVPYAKHFPPVDPSWPTAYPQIVRLLHRYTGDTRVVSRHLASLKDYVDYIASVTSCPNCPADDTRSDTRAPNGLPWFYMNGDWMEFVPQDVELSDSGKICSSFHYIKDVRIVAGLSHLVGDVNGSAVYNALADSLVAKFNNVYVTNKQTNKNIKQTKLTSNGNTLNV